MTRPRSKPIKVFVTEDERSRITALAKSANLSLSAYLRAAGLNQQIRSVLDVQAVTELSKVNGVLGNVAGTLKLWLAEQHEEKAAYAPDIRKVIKEFQELQKKSHEIMGRMLR